MKNLSFDFRKMFYLIIALLLNLSIIQTESWAQRWVIHTIPELPGENVYDMLLDRYGDIWIATENGIGIFNGEWIKYDEDNGLINNDVHCITQDKEGNIWFGTTGGISVIDPLSDLNDPDNWDSLTVSNTDSGLVSNQINSVVVDSAGNIWFGTESSGVNVVKLSSDSRNPFQSPFLDRENWTTYTTDDGLSSNRIRYIEVDAMGDVWIATSQGIDRYELESDSLKRFNLDPSASDKIHVIFMDRSGNIWVGTEIGVYEVNPITNLTTFYTNDNTKGGLANNDVKAITQDKEGVIWFGHADNGVSLTVPNSDLLDPANWGNFRMIDGLADRSVYSIIEDLEENMWFAHWEKRGISQLDRTWFSFLTDMDLETNLVNGLFIDNQRNLWIATDAGAVRLSLDANLLIADSLKDLFTKSNGLKGERVFSIFQDNQSFLWFGTNEGIDRIVIDAVKDTNKWYHPDILDRTIINSITEDTQGYIWIGTYYGVFRVHIDSTFNEANWLNFSSFDGDGIISDHVHVIFLDTRGYLWFGTDYGISLFNPALNPNDPTNWKSYNTSNGLVNNYVHSIYEDINGNIWFATERGVSKVNPTNNLEYPENWINYTTIEGLASNFVTSITQLKNHEFWFGTAIGASKLDTTKLINEWTKYTISSGLKSNRISSLIADNVNKDIWFGTRGGGVTRYRPKQRPPETFLDDNYDIITQSRVKFKFHGADIVTPEEHLRYQYQLDNNGWRETGDTTAIVNLGYSDKPQRHTFQVRAIDTDGNIDPTPATDVFYEIYFRLGGKAELIHENRIISLYIPPNILIADKYITFKPIKKYELSDTTNVLFAYDISVHDNLGELKHFELAKPAKLTITFLDSIGYEKNQLAIFHLNDYQEWDAIGGTIDITLDTVKTITISTTINESGIYSVRNKNVDKTDHLTDKVNIQPRIFSPGTGDLGHGNHATISFLLKENSNTTVKIYNIAGRLKKVLLENVYLLTGINTLDWDGKDNNGNFCPTGLYIVTIETESNVKTKTVMISNKYKN